MRKLPSERWVVYRLPEVVDEDGLEAVRRKAAAESQLLLEMLDTHARDVGGVQSGVHGRQSAKIKNEIAAAP